VNIFLLARHDAGKSVATSRAARYKYRFCIGTASACPDPIRPADPGRRLHLSSRYSPLSDKFYIVAALSNTATIKFFHKTDRKR